MQNNITFDFDDINALQEQAKILRDKATALAAKGEHARAADLIEVVNCASVVRSLVERMTYLLCKCPCCYEPVTMN